MNKKIISIISYITIIGWVIAFVVYHNGHRSALAQYHLKQSFGLGVFGGFFYMLFMATYPMILIIPIISVLLILLSIVMFVILISGIINAVNQKKKPILLIGPMFVGRFNFIKY